MKATYRLSLVVIRQPDDLRLQSAAEQLPTLAVLPGSLRR
jgi:hypothetical protein